MRRLAAALALAVLTGACSDQPTAPDQTVRIDVLQARVPASERNGWVEMFSVVYAGEVARFYPCLDAMQVFGTQTFYAKYTSPGWGGLNIIFDHVYEPGFYVQEVGTETMWYPTSTAQPGHFQLKRDGSSYRAGAEVLEDYASDDGRSLKVRTWFSFDVAPEWDGTGPPPVLLDTFESRVQACVVH